MSDTSSVIDVADRTCVIDGCGRARRAKGWCSKHYYVFRKDQCDRADCSRPRRAKGLCAQHYRASDSRVRPCRECGVEFSGDIRSSFCSGTCKRNYMKGPFNRALDTGDPQAIVAAARESSVETPKGCWEWMYAVNKGTGYPTISHKKTTRYVHRHVVAAFLGRPIGRESVHHKCANRLCVNPDHLQLVSQRENMAEMFERNYYIKRIAELEEALFRADPTNPALLSANLSDKCNEATVTETSTAS